VLFADEAFGYMTVNPAYSGLGIAVVFELKLLEEESNFEEKEKSSDPRFQHFADWKSNSEVFVLNRVELANGLNLFIHDVNDELNKIKFDLLQKNMQGFSLVQAIVS